MENGEMKIKGVDMQTEMEVVNKLLRNDYGRRGFLTGVVIKVDGLNMLMLRYSDEDDYTFVTKRDIKPVNDE